MSQPDEPDAASQMFFIALLQMLAMFEKRWRSEPTTILLPAASREWGDFTREFVDAIVDKPTGTAETDAV